MRFVQFLTIVGCCAAQSRVSFRSEKLHHQPKQLNNEHYSRLARLTNTSHMNEILDNICVKRVVGTPQHEAVKKYIIKSMQDLDWSVETDKFSENTPTFGQLTFENIIARLNPTASRYLVLACHFDSKYTREGDFVGATDSAVPCAQMINLANVMSEKLESAKTQNVSLMFIFFDGEEAFQTWGPTDSIYGARHLATKWHNTPYPPNNNEFTTELDRIDVMVLLDLLGAPDPTFYNYFQSTQKWYTMLVEAENQLASMRTFDGYTYGQPKQKYFRPYSIQANIEDDHIPFMERDVPILHLIPAPFPSFWHKSGDNRNNIDMATTENINKILRVFVASYLKLII